MNQLLSTTLYSRGTLGDPTLNRLMDYQRAQLEKVVKHYRDLKRAAPSDHPLSRIVSSITPPLNSDALGIYEWAVEGEHTLAHGAGITTKSMFEQSHAGLFFDDSYDFLVTDGRMRPGDVLETTIHNWQDIRPVTIKCHNSIFPISYYPLGNRDTGEHYSVVGVDIPALAVMHYYWKTQNDKQPVALRETPDHFIGRYVLPNALYSLVNASLVNLGLRDHLEISLPREANKVGLNAVRDYWNDISEQWESFTSELMGRNLRPSEYLAYLPAIETNQSLFDQRPIIDTPDTPTTYPHLLMANVNITLLSALGVGLSGSTDHLKTGIKMMERRIRMRRPYDKLPFNYVRDNLRHKVEFIGLVL